jgi:hypothetical protein
VGAGDASGAAINTSLKTPFSVLLPMKIPPETRPYTESPVETGLLRKPLPLAEMEYVPVKVKFWIVPWAPFANWALLMVVSFPSMLQRAKPG